MSRQVRKRINHSVTTTVQLNPKHNMTENVLNNHNKKLTKLSFRTKVLDPSKPMNIYIAEELPNLIDYSVFNRAVPQMPSGMDKNEEFVRTYFVVKFVEKYFFEEIIIKNS